MGINRLNYEEYFILYMDNELTDEERLIVEDFVLQHPELKEELELLQQFKLAPDSSINFPYKEDLLKEKGEALITLNNYEEWLVLYIDNELNQQQRIKVEAFLTSNPTAAATLTLFQKATLQPEQVVFSHKQSLYRSEEKVRLLAFKWGRAVAAILILGLGITATLLLNNKSQNSIETAGINSIKPGNETPGMPKENTPAEKITNKSTNNIAGSNSTHKPVPEIANTPVFKQAVANSSKEPGQKYNRKDEKQPPVLQAINNQAPVIAESTKKQDNNLPKPDQNRFVNSVKENKAIVQNNTPPVIPDDNISTTKDVVTITSPQPSDYILASTDGKKNKNRGLFRKIARTFEKRTNINPTDEGDRLLVAGFSINMK